MKIFLTTAIDYVNSLPHIGTAYEKIGADVIARFRRLCGDEVLFQMGNDEHSANVQKAAEAAGLPPKKYCDEMRPKFEAIWKKLHISYDRFIQTSDQNKHYPTVYEFFDRVNKAGDIYQKDYEGWYCESCEAFYTEKDLENGLCKNHQKKPAWIKEKNYFFKLKKYEKALLNHIEANPGFILPAKRKNEVASFIKQGLEDFSISRSTFTWGIPVPLDKTHVFYVWFDALINYLSWLGLKSLDDLKDNEYWKNVMHIVGKDITRFHCIIWPAMLMSAGLPLPKTVFGHGFVYLRGEKMSKSLGNVVTPLDILEKYPDFGADALRYYLMRGSSFGDDGDFTWDGFIERYNADLANGIGNLASRILGMVWRYQGGSVSPRPFEESQEDLIFKANEVWEYLKIDLSIDEKDPTDIRPHRALEAIWRFISAIDQYIDRRAPWQLAKDKKVDDLSQILTLLVECVRRLSIFCGIFVPDASKKIWRAYGFDKWKNFSDIRAPDQFDSPLSKMPHKLTELKLNLFPRIQVI
ncbi:MAG: methionine--tRNA ligase [Deltaproteobacteria bacterium]|nr:methionine--tRNA ligase [Deltaproteobacteria bacterium]